MLPLLNEFKEKVLREGRCLGTMKTKEKCCLYFARWFGSDNMQKVSRKDIEKYKNYLMNEHRTPTGKKISGSWLNHRLWSIMEYFKFLVENKKIFFDPTLNVVIPKRKRKFLVEYLTEKEMQDLINLPDTYTYAGIRDRLVFELLYTCPMRNNELCRLKVTDIDLKEKYIYPSRSKGGRECGIPIVLSTHQIIEKYLEIARPRLMARNPGVEELIISTRGTAITMRGIASIFAKYRSGDLKYHAHAIRRACAIHMLKNGASARDIQVLLGHKRLTSTQFYTQLATNELKDIQEKHHPREKQFRKVSKSS